MTVALQRHTRAPAALPRRTRDTAVHQSSAAEIHSRRSTDCARVRARPRYDFANDHHQLRTERGARWHCRVLCRCGVGDSL